MTSWKKCKLGDLALQQKGAIKSGPFGSNIGSRFFVPKGVPVIRGNNLTSGKEKFIDDGFVFLTEQKARELNCWAEKDDLLFTAAGTIGQVGLLTGREKYPRYVISNKQIKVSLNRELIDPLFAYYWFSSPEIVEYIQNHNTGSTIPLINLSVVKSIPVNLPNWQTQQKIASILASLDDKIALNRRMNQTLEQMAAKLFKKYFVDDIDPENPPVGWRFGTLADVIQIKHGYAFKGEFFTDDKTNDLLLTPGNFKIGGGFSYSKFKYYKGLVPEEYVLERDDLIVTMTDLSKDGDTLGYPALVPAIEQKRLLHNQRIGKVIYKNSDSLKFFLYWLMRSDEYRNFVLGGATGTTVKHTSPSRVCEFKCIIPSEGVLTAFNRQVELLYKLELRNEQQSQVLSEVRDTLLPKLMSGEIDLCSIHQNEELHAEVFS
jgi:type I restriction enzyme S subunit